MKAILINAQKQEVSEIVLNKDNYLRDTYEAIGNGCALVQSGIYLNETEALMVDEEGYFKDGLSGFTFDGRFFYGNGIIWNCDEEGESISCQSTVESIMPRVKWVNSNKSQYVRENVLDSPTVIIFK